MAKIAFIVEYNPNIKYYPDCETIEECVTFDIEAMKEGAMDPAEFISNYYDDIEIKAVSDDE